MNDNLARFERLAQRAAERRQAHEAAERAAENERWEQEWGSGAEERSRQSPEFLVGPPNGCPTCYTWRRAKLGGWFWTHNAVPDRAPDGEENEEGWPGVTCHHACHGAAGLFLPYILRASA